MLLQARTFLHLPAVASPAASAAAAAQAQLGKALSAPVSLAARLEAAAAAAAAAERDAVAPDCPGMRSYQLVALSWQSLVACVRLSHVSSFKPQNNTSARDHVCLKYY